MRPPWPSSSSWPSWDHVEAQYNTGVLYYHGHGTAADPEKALYWFQRAAGWGHRESQYNCGVLYRPARVPPPTWPPPAPGLRKPPPRVTRGPSRPWPLWTPPRPEEDPAALFRQGVEAYDAGDY